MEETERKRGWPGIKDTVFWCETLMQPSQLKLMQTSQLKLCKIFTGRIFSHIFRKIYYNFWRADHWIQVGEVNCFVSPLSF